jgi:hypothetical protein
VTERLGEMRYPKRLLLVVLFVAAGCEGADTSEGGIDSQPAPVDTAADAGTAVSTDTTSDEVDIFTVTQAEEGCVVSGPAEVPANETYYFIVKNPAEPYADLNLYVSRLTDGKTFQDLIEPQTYPGEYYPKPSWVVYAKRETAQAEEFSLATELADDEQAFAFTVEPGPHVIYTYTGGALWFCAPFQVE